MIYTVTLNPSIDYIVKVPGFELNKTNRTSEELMLPGGKGINVSIVLSNMAINNIALGFIAGFTGEEIVRRLNELNINTDFIRALEGTSRINVKLKDIDGTEINGNGPVISKENVDELFGKLDKLKEGDVLVLAGSVPGCMTNDIYKTIINTMSGRGVMVIVDASGKQLASVLGDKPFLIKPNKHELSEFFGVSINDATDAINYAKKLRELGARNVLVSLGGDGAILVSEQEDILVANAPSGKLVNSVGAGDSMVAGFIAGYLNTGSYLEAFKRGVACGSASAFSDYLATAKEIENIYSQVEVIRKGSI